MSEQSDIKAALQRIDDYEFERFIADMWTATGWETRVLQASNDKGIDVEARRADPFEQKHLIQAKRYSAGNNVGSEAAQQYASLRHQEENVDAVVIVTTSDFTRQAEEVAGNLNLKLINGDDLARMIQEQNAMDMLRKYASGESNDMETAPDSNGTTATQSLQKLNPRNVSNIYVSKLVDNALGDSITKKQLTKLSLGFAEPQAPTKNPILAHLYKSEQPHFALLSSKIRLPKRGVLSPPNKVYLVATDHRILILIGTENKDEDITIPYRQVNDIEYLMTMTGAAKIELKTEKGTFRIKSSAIHSWASDYKEMQKCAEFIKETVYSQI